MSPTRSSSSFESVAFVAMRVVFGFLYSLHGMQKMFGWFGATFHPALGSQLWFAGIIELVCGLLIIFGLLTRPAAFLAAGEMAVAYFQVHFQLHFAGSHWVPFVNKGEPAVLYCFGFLLILARGGGLASLDGWLTRSRGRGAQIRQTI